MHGVQVRSSGSTGGYVDLINKWGSAWETPNAPAYPLDVNIIGADGDSVRRPPILGADIRCCPTCFVKILASVQQASGRQTPGKACADPHFGTEGRVRLPELHHVILEHGIDAWGAAQTTAYQALSGPGQLGKIPTGVQFRITNPGDTAVRLAFRSTCRHCVYHTGLCDNGVLVLVPHGMLASLAGSPKVKSAPARHALPQLPP